jgi:excisionase family DNA binding protein
MSSKIEVQRICQQCGIEFTARTTVTRYCSHKCGSAAHKQKLRARKVEESNKQTQQVKNRPIEELKAKEFLTVREVASLLNCSVRSAYFYIESGKISAVNLGKRITRVKRSDIDKLFQQPQMIEPLPERGQEQDQFNILECYSTEEVRLKYNISESGLRGLIIKHNIPKYRKGWFAYVSKRRIDDIFNNKDGK